MSYSLLAPKRSEVESSDVFVASILENRDSSEANQDTNEIFRVANATLAANLSPSFPKTPQKVTQNSAKKRRPLPDLTRPKPSPSHGENMSMIFRDASATLQEIQATAYSPSSIGMPRLPLSQARRERFGSVNQDDRRTISSIETPFRARKARNYPIESEFDLTKADQTSCSDRPTQTPLIAKHFDGVINASMPKHRSFHEHGSSIPLSGPPEAQTASHLGDVEKEPISSGFASPSALYSQSPKTPEEVQYPGFEHWRLPQSSSRGASPPRFGSEESLSSHVTTSVLPASQHHAENMPIARIETWLNGIQVRKENINQSDAQRQGIVMNEVVINKCSSSQKVLHGKSRTQKSQFVRPKSGEDLPSLSRSSSNKENVSPVKSTPSPAHARIPYLTTAPSRFRNPNIEAAQGSGSALYSPKPLAPQGHLNLPPRRKKTRVDAELKLDSSRSGKDFTIHDDQVTDALAQLSPDVELRRKGRRRKRERCMSYWDDDILPASSPCLPVKTQARSISVRKDKKVLGESQQTDNLTKDQPFTREAEDAAFDFQL